jgi:hypothetical protein
VSSLHYGYSVYGLDVSATLPIEGLRPSSGEGAPLRVEFLQAHSIPPLRAAPHFASGYEAFWRCDDRWVLRYSSPDPDIPPWMIEAGAGGERLQVRYCHPAQLPDIGTLLLGPGFSLALHLRHFFPLHASAIEIGGRAALILGASGAGKSTLAAAAFCRGLRVITDDVAVLDWAGTSVCVRWGPARLRTYSDSARAAGWSGPLPRLFHHPIFDDKRYIDLSGQGMTDAGCPLGAIYVIEPRRHGLGEPMIEPMTSRLALSHLLNNIYSGRFLGPEQYGECVARCTALAAGVPVRSVTPVDDLTRLPALVESIADDVARLG